MLWSVAVALPLDPADFVALAPLLDPAQPVIVDTTTLILDDGVTQHTGVVDGNVAVFAFGAVTLDEDTAIVGVRPAALLSHGSFDLSASVDLSGYAELPGPGGYHGGDCGAGVGPGGAGSNVYSAGGGGFGGEGGGTMALAGPAYGDLIVVLQGGSGGGSPTYSEYATCFGGAGGGGGGAVELGARGIFTLGGGVVARGGDGSGFGYPGGGGSGGGIFLHGQGGTCTGTVTASGGNATYGYYGVVGGGGGGRVVVSGVDTTGCLIDVAGGIGSIGGMPGVLSLYDPDQDADGYTILAGADCGDRDPAVHPGAAEDPADGIDGDCDGTELCYVDGDQDGARSTTTAPADLACATPGFADGAAALDCDDASAAVSPAATEVTCNGLDDDCAPATPDAVDDDGDGSFCPEDCDDADPDRAPGVAEACDGVDQDCDGQLDEGFPRSTWYVDADADGFGDPAGAVDACDAPPDHVGAAGDCDDADPDVHPDAVEACNGHDDDCRPDTPDALACAEGPATTPGPAEPRSRPGHFVVHGCGVTPGATSIGLFAAASLRRRRWSS